MLITHDALLRYIAFIKPQLWRCCRGSVMASVELSGYERSARDTWSLAVSFSPEGVYCLMGLFNPVTAGL